MENEGDWGIKYIGESCLRGPNQQGWEVIGPYSVQAYLNHLGVFQAFPVRKRR